MFATYSRPVLDQGGALGLILAVAAGFAVFSWWKKKGSSNTGSNSKDSNTAAGRSPFAFSKVHQVGVLNRLHLVKLMHTQLYTLFLGMKALMKALSTEVGHQDSSFSLGVDHIQPSCYAFLASFNVASLIS